MHVVRNQNVPIYSSVVVSEFYVNTNIQHPKNAKKVCYDAHAWKCNIVSCQKILSHSESVNVCSLLQFFIC